MCGAVFCIDVGYYRYTSGLSMSYLSHLSIGQDFGSVLQAKTVERAEGERDVDTPVQVCVEALVVCGEALYHDISRYSSSFPSPSHY